MDLLRSRRPTAARPELGTGVSLRPGTLLTVEGERGDEFFVIERGRVGISRGGHPVAVLGPGEHFGEIALLTPERRRTATVAALDDLKVRVYDRREFVELLRREPETEARLLRCVADRLAA